MTWTSLTGSQTTAGSIARWLNRRDLTSDDASEILDEVISWVSVRLRHWKQLSTPQMLTMTVGADQIAIPSDLQEPDLMMINGVVSGSYYRQVIRQRALNDVYQSWGYDDSGARVRTMPRRYSFNSSYFQLDNQPDLAYPYVFSYYKEIALLSSGNPTNFLTDGYQRLVRCVSMFIGAEFIKETQQGPYDRTYWMQQANDELLQAQEQSDNARRGAHFDVYVDIPQSGEANW